MLMAIKNSFSALLKMLKMKVHSFEKTLNQIQNFTTTAKCQNNLFDFENEIDGVLFIPP